MLLMTWKLKTREKQKQKKIQQQQKRGNATGERDTSDYGNFIEVYSSLYIHRNRIIISVSMSVSVVVVVFVPVAGHW